MRFKLIGLICLIMQCNLSCTQHIINKETVQTLDLHRYMGKWFEIARFDHRFEHNLVGATVEYSFLPNGDIEVVNSGYWGNFSGSFKRAKGIAKITDPTCPSKLKVCFFMRFYAEYNIMEIDEDNYSYALVGSNTSDYLWLLSRTPTLPEEAILFLLTKAKERGYIIRKTKCFDFWERNVLFPKTKRSFFRTPKHPLPCPFPLNFSLLIITKKFGNLAKNRYICIV